MDNQENPTYPINQYNSNIECFSPYQEGIYNSQIKSPFKSNITINFTPSKYLEFPFGCFGLENTPFSPQIPQQKFELPFHSQNFQKNLISNESSPFKPMFSSPFFFNNNLSEKKTPEQTPIPYMKGIKGINLTEKFNEAFSFKNEAFSKICYNINKENSDDENNKKNKEDINNPIIKNQPLKTSKKRKLKKIHDSNKNCNKINDLNFVVKKSNELLDKIKNCFNQINDKNNNNKNGCFFKLLNSTIFSDFISYTSKKDNLKIKNSKSSEHASNSSFTTNNSVLEKNETFKCTCKNSNCLKFYCECFANGKTCQNCLCCNCQNTIEYKELRDKKYEEIIVKNPNAIKQINNKKRSWTCKCKNSFCSKKYCDCYQNHKFCTSKCKCINCRNVNVYGGKKKKRKIMKTKVTENKENEENILSNDYYNKYYTPRKNKYQEVNIINSQKDFSTTAFTGKKTKRNKFIDKGKDNKNSKTVYKKLEMDI